MQVNDSWNAFGTAAFRSVAQGGSAGRRELKGLKGLKGRKIPRLLRKTDCPGRDSNPHGRSRGILSPLRLPISPPGRGAGVGHGAGKGSGGGMWRLSPESNRGTRLCRPLHDHSATQPAPRRGSIRTLVRPARRNWSGKRDSNSRPQPWQGCALPTELFPLGYNVRAETEF